MSEKMELTTEHAYSYLEAELNRNIGELEQDLLPHLTHGEKNQLISAMIRYPAYVTDFTGQKLELIKAYSATKRLFDLNVAIATELVEEGKQELEKQND